MFLYFCRWIEIFSGWLKSVWLGFGAYRWLLSHQRCMDLFACARGADYRAATAGKTLLSQATYLGKFCHLNVAYLRRTLGNFWGINYLTIRVEFGEKLTPEKRKKIRRNSREIKSWRLKNIISSFYFSSLIFILVIFMGCFYNFIEYFYNMLD